jgi:putative drug exporter of the RND superfamily
LLVIAQVRREFMELDNQVITRRAKEIVSQISDQLKQTSKFKDAQITYELTGLTVLSDDMLSASAESMQRTEWITVALVLGFVLVVYRAPFLALIPFAAICAAWWCGLKIVTLLVQWDGLWNSVGWHPHMFTMIRIFITVLVFGSGTDFCLFIIARYREELKRESDFSTAMQRAITGVRGAVWGSAFTSIVGMALLGFADFGKFQSAGFAVSICLIMTWAASMSLTPALLFLLGNRALWPAKIRPQSINTADRTDVSAPSQDFISLFWERASRMLLRNPFSWWCASMLLLAIPIFVWYKVEPDRKIRYDLLGVRFSTIPVPILFNKQPRR